MSIRGTPELRTMTARDFFVQALDEPMSVGDTLSGAAAEGINQSPTLGLIVREGRTPPLAFDAGVDHPALQGRPPLPHMPGQEDLQKPEFGTAAPWEDPRVGARPSYRLMSPQEVKDRGDTLFTSEDEMKQSPYYREAIPFDPGMTASRLKSLADQYDLAQVRAYYSAKRPIAGFIGSLGGFALEPTNYIPIFGEAALAASTARAGAIGGRILVGAGDAVANTAIFQTLTATERAKWGDDTTWQTLATDMAFAAVAGSIFGAAFGKRADPKVVEDRKSVV